MVILLSLQVVVTCFLAILVLKVREIQKAEKKLRKEVLKNEGNPLCKG